MSTHITLYPVAVLTEAGVVTPTNLPVRALVKRDAITSIAEYAEGNVVITVCKADGTEIVMQVGNTYDELMQFKMSGQ